LITSSPHINSNNEILIGILSIEPNLSLRNAQRKTWLSSKVFDFKFIFDNETPGLVAENDQYHDIVFLNASYTGKAYRYGEKLHLWFKYAMKNYPDKRVIVKADDDVFLCPEQIKSRLLQPGAEKIYYGWKHGNVADKNIGYNSRIDEQFVGVGHDLVQRLADSDYCEFERGKTLSMSSVKRLKQNCSDSLPDTNYGGTSLGMWLGKFDDVMPVFDNDVLIHYNGPVYTELSTRIANHEKVNVCSDFYLFHKSSEEEMYELWTQYLGSL